MPRQFQPQLPGLPNLQLPPNIPQGGGLPGTIPQAPAAGPSGLDAFLQQITDPTGSSQFLLDLGARLLQPRAKGSSPLGAIAGAASESVSGLAGRKQAASTAALQQQLAAGKLATGEAQREKLGAETASLEADITKVPAEIAALKAQAAKDKTTGVKLPAAKVQEITKVGQIYRDLDPSLTKAEAEQKAFDALQPVGKDPNTWLAGQLATLEQDAIIAGYKPEQKAEIRKGIFGVYQDWVDAQTIAPAPAAPPPPEIQVLMDSAKAGEKLSGDQMQQVVQHFQSIATSPTEARDMYLQAIGQEIPGKAAASAPVEDTRPIAPRTTESDVPSPPPKRVAVKERKAQKVANKKEAARMVKEELPQMAVIEVQKWLEKNRSLLSAPQRRRIQAIIKRKQKGK